MQNSRLSHVAYVLQRQCPVFRQGVNCDDPHIDEHGFRNVAIFIAETRNHDVDHGLEGGLFVWSQMLKNQESKKRDDTQHWH